MYNLKNSKLSLTLESLMTRYRIGSFLVGDQIKFKPSIKNSEHYKKLPSDKLDILNDIIVQANNEDSIVKIVSLNDEPFMGGVPSSMPASFEVGIDMGGGQYLTIVSLPGELINEIERVIPEPNNVPQTIGNAAKFVYDENPEREVEITDEDQEGEDNTLPVKQPVHKLPKADNKIKGTTAKEVDYTKNIKSKMDLNNVTFDTKSKA